MDFTRWFTTWLARHPLKLPPEPDRARYTAQVMERIRALEAPRPSPKPSRLWLPWPRLALVAATAVVGLAVVIGVLREEAGHVARTITPEPRFVLTESSPSDDQWIEQTLQLLEELEEELPEDASTVSEEEWLEELEQLDQSELAVSS